MMVSLLPRDLDIHVEFLASQIIKCKCDFSMKRCGGVRFMIDTIGGVEKGADVIKLITFVTSNT